MGQSAREGGAEKVWGLRCCPSLKGSPTPPKVGVLKVPNVLRVHFSGSGAMLCFFPSSCASARRRQAQRNDGGSEARK
jgi:hypothetical protein